MGKYRAYSEYKDSGVPWAQDIPSHWEMVRNLGLFEERNQKDHPDEELLAITIKHGILKQTELAELTDRKDTASEDKSNYKLVVEGDIAYNKMRMWQGAIGVSAYRGIVSPAYIVLKPAPRVDSRYFYYQFKTPGFISESGRSSYGLCDDMNSLRYKDFRSLYSVTPPPDEQTQIAAFLDRETAKIDRLIAKQEALIELLKEKRQAVISHAVTKGLAPDAPMKDSGVEWLGEIPKHWEVSQLRFHTRWIGGATPSKDNADYWNGNVPWVTPKDMKRPRIGESIDTITDTAVAETSVSLVPKSSVLIVVRGMILARMVPVAITTTEVTVNQDMKALVPSPTLSDAYLHYLLAGAERRLFDMVDNSAHGTKCLRTELLQRLEIPLPPLEEQVSLMEKLEKKLERLDHLVGKVDTAIGFLKERRTALISAAVTGKIDVREEIA